MNCRVGLATLCHHTRSHIDWHYRVISMYINVIEPTATITNFISDSLRQRTVFDLGAPLKSTDGAMDHSQHK
jgi:hypothetical protein